MWYNICEVSAVEKNNDKKWIGQKFGRLTVIGFEKKKEPSRG